MDHTKKKDSDAECFEKAREQGEPTFTLRAQDATAALLVETWVRAQIFVRAKLEEGLTMSEALALLNDKLGRVAPINYKDTTDKKLFVAILIANGMVAWPNRKLAD